MSHLEEDYVHVDVSELNHASGNNNGVSDDYFQDHGSGQRRKSTSDKYQSPLSDSNGSMDSSSDRRIEEDKDKYFGKHSDNPIDDLS